MTTDQEREAEWEASKTREMRDIMATCALLGILASGNDHVNGSDDPQLHSALAYRYAESMLAERAKRDNTPTAEGVQPSPKR